MAFLYQIQPDRRLGDCWTVDEKPVVVGRGEFADAVVEDDALSRSHFLVVREGKDFFVVDLDSQNGTWVDGQPVSGRKVRPGQLIRAGCSVFYFSEQRLAVLPAAAVTAAPFSSLLTGPARA